MQIKYNIAKVAALSSRFVLKNIFRRQAGFYPGNLALKIDNDILCKLADEFDAGTVLVTGTNGKTSVTALIASLMNEEGYNVSWNKGGANLESGVVAAILSFKKQVSSNFGVYEVDELWVKKVLPKLKSKYLLLLNLFPDQVDRFGGIDAIQNSLIKALKYSPKTTLIYNADDPNCQYIADNCDNPCVSFGMKEKITNSKEYNDIDCPGCGQKLSYILHQYAQLGKYKCTNCGFNRAKLKYGASNIKLDSKCLQFDVENHSYSSKKAAEYVCYNLTGFVACGMLLRCQHKNISKVIENQKNDNGRLQYFDINGKKVMINLAKNPVGFNQNINYVLSRIKDASSNEAHVVAFFANAREGDGHSTEWFNDVHFNKLIDQKNLSVFYGGEASKDLNLAIGNKDLYAKKVENAQDLLGYAASADNIFIIANYTAMFPLRDELIKMSK